MRVSIHLEGMGYLFTAAILRGQTIPRRLSAEELEPLRTPGSFEAFHVLPENEGWLVRDGDLRKLK